MWVHDLLLQDVGLVEKQDDGRALEPGICDDGFEQRLALFHAVLQQEKQLLLESKMFNKVNGWINSETFPHLIVTLHQDLVVLTQRHQEDDRRDILEAVDPLPPLWPLTSDIHHPARASHDEQSRAWTVWLPVFG